MPGLSLPLANLLDSGRLSDAEVAELAAFLGSLTGLYRWTPVTRL